MATTSEFQTNGVSRALVLHVCFRDILKPGKQELKSRSRSRCRSTRTQM